MHVLIFLPFLTTTLSAITIPGENVDKKTLTTLGIKTLDWQQENDQSQLVDGQDDDYGQLQIGPTYKKPGYEMRHDLQHIIAAEQHNLEDFDQYVQSSSNFVEQHEPEQFYQCPKDQSGQFPYALSCNQFWNCWKGRGFLQNCAPGTLFNPYTLECDYASKVKCLLHSKSEAYTQESLNNLHLKTGCPNGFSGIVPHHYDCSKFINCDNGKEVIMDCGPGTLFNLKINSCDYPYNTECASWSSQYGQIGDQNSEGSSSNNVYASVDNSKKVQCPPDAVGLLPHRWDCSKFLNCDAGNTFILDCGPGTHFHPETKVCDYPHNVNCENRDDYSGKIDVRGPPELQCPWYVEGVFPHPYSCSKYVNCYRGLTEIKECPRGLMYDPVSNGCNDAFHVDCSRKNVNNIWDQSTSQTQHNQNWNQNQQTGTNWNANGGQNQENTGWNQQSQGKDQHGWDQSAVNQGQGSTTWNQNTNQHGQNQGGTTWGQNTNQGQHQGGSTWGQGTNQHGQNQGGTTWGQNTNQGQNQGSTTWDQGTNQQGQNQGGTTWGQSTNQQGQNQGGTTWNQNTNQGQSQGGTTWGQGTNQQGQNQGGTTWGQNTNQGHYQGGTTEGHGTNQHGQNQGGITWGQNTNQGQHQGGTTWEQGTNHQGQNQGSTTWGQNTSQGQEQGSTTWGQGTNQHGGTTWNQNTNQGQHQGGTTWGQNTNQGQNQGGTTTNQHGQNQGGTTWGQNTNQGQHHGSTTGGQSTNQHEQNQSGTTWGQTTNQQGLNHGNDNWGQGTNQQGQTTWSQNTNQQGQTGSTSGQGWHQQSQNGGTGWNQGTNHQGQNQGGTTWSQGTNQQGQNQGGQQGQTTWGQGWHQQSQSGGTGWNQSQNGNQQGSTVWSQGTDQQSQNGGTTWNQQGQTTSNQGTGNQRPGTNWNQNSWHGTDQQSQNVDQTWSESQVNENSIHSTKNPTKNPTKNQPSANIIQKDVCTVRDFYCTRTTCIPRTMRCDGVEDCPNGKDEQDCEKLLDDFAVTQNHILAVREKEKFFNVSLLNCAKACLESLGFQCRSFSFRRDDGACFLSDSNVGTSGSLILSYAYDYYELAALAMNCTNLHKCPNDKCISRKQICDGVNDCGDRTDEKGCSAQALGYEIRLAGTAEKHTGRIEIKAFGQTGYICDDKFGLRNADVVCKELGYPLGAIEVKGNSHFAQDVKDQHPLYMMDDVMCLGNETSIRDCDFNGWGVSNCEPQEIVGVVCKTPQETCPKDHWKCDTVPECLPLAFLCDGVFDCTDESDEASQHCDAPSEMRLVGGSSKYEGRLEVRHYGTWGTVCDDDFNDDAAKVVCQYLGYPGKAYVKKEGGYGPGTGPIWLDQVFCQGNETSLEHCVHWNWGEHNCEHSEDVGVNCSKTEMPLVEAERNAKIENIPERVFVEQCGLRKDAIFLNNDEVHFRVVGGAIAKKGDYPWQASLRIKNQGQTTHWCGAVVITKKFILTAAHCLQGFSKGAYVVVAGDYNTDEFEGTEQEAYIEEFYIHERFRDGQKMNNDIGLIKLKGEGFTFTKDVQPICLPSADTQYLTGLNCTISGFGSIQSGKSSYSHDMRAAYIPLIKQDVCEMPHVYGDTITDGMVCAGTLDEGADSCEGDSGGPLACLHEGYYTLYGLTSWGHHCGHANKPGVYVRVAHYRKWIDDTIFKHI